MRARLDPDGPGSERQRATAGEAVLEAVPEADLLLAEPPAEEDLLAGALGGEVDEPLVEVLHERSELVDPAHAGGDSGHLLVQLLLHLPELARAHIPAVAGDP